MDTICGVGLPELIVLALVAFVVIGPERSREMAVKLGRFIRTVMKSPWWKEFNQMAAAVRDLPTTLVRMSELEDELRTVRTDLERATQIDFNRVPGTPGAAQDVPSADPSRDPWGVLTQAPPIPSTAAPPRPLPQASDVPSPSSDDEQPNNG